MSEPLVAVHEVTRRYGATSEFALAPATLSVEAGTLVTLAGRSGAGKTTLLQIMAALDRPDSGSVQLFGAMAAQMSDSALSRIRRQRIGIVYQRFEFLEKLPVWQNITMRLVPEGVAARERRARAARLLEELGVPHAIDRMPSALSGGERQRVALARALCASPQLVFADEPTSNVDDATAAQVIAYLLELREQGVAIVASTHDSALVKHADRRLRMAAGVLSE